MKHSRQINGIAALLMSSLLASGCSSVLGTDNAPANHNWNHPDATGALGIAQESLKKSNRNAGDIERIIREIINIRQYLYSHNPSSTSSANIVDPEYIEGMRREIHEMKSDINNIKQENRRHDRKLSRICIDRNSIGGSIVVPCEEGGR